MPETQPDDFDRSSLLYHYTSAQGLEGIVRTQSLWATDTAFLNDTTEIRYAAEPLIKRMAEHSSTLPVESAQSVQSSASGQHLGDRALSPDENGCVVALRPARSRSSTARRPPRASTTVRSPTRRSPIMRHSDPEGDTTDLPFLAEEQAAGRCAAINTGRRCVCSLDLGHAGAHTALAPADDPDADDEVVDTWIG